MAAVVKSVNSPYVKISPSNISVQRKKIFYFPFWSQVQTQQQFSSSKDSHTDVGCESVHCKLKQQLRIDFVSLHIIPAQVYHAPLSESLKHIRVHHEVFVFTAVDNSGAGKAPEPDKANTSSTVTD